jgi:hypothetical protein
MLFTFDFSRARKQSLVDKVFSRFTWKNFCSSETAIEFLFAPHGSF